MADTQFSIEIEDSGAAFHGDTGERNATARAEIARLLRAVADRIEAESGAEADALEARGAAAMRAAARTHAGDVPGALDALRALAGDNPPADPLPPVSGAYGAPMGRTVSPLDPDAEPIELRRVTLDPGGYDSGGAYWGTGAPLWRVTDGAGGCAYVRAGSAREAVAVAFKSWDRARGVPT